MKLRTKNSLIKLLQVRELELECKILSHKLPPKLDNIFGPTIEVTLGVNEITALCDQVLVFQPYLILFLVLVFQPYLSLFLSWLNLCNYNITELKLHLVDSIFQQVVGVKENIVLQIKGSPAFLDLVIVDMTEDPIAPIYLVDHFKNC